MPADEVGERAGQQERSLPEAEVDLVLVDDEMVGGQARDRGQRLGIEQDEQPSDALPDRVGLGSRPRA